MKRLWSVFFVLFLFSLSAISPPIQEILDLFGIEEENIQTEWLQQGKERWEFDKRYEYVHPVVWPMFEKAGLVFEIAPKKAYYDYALVCGALLSTVEKRIAYLADLWKKGIRFNQIVFLTGERHLLISEQAICLGETETDMVEWVFARSDLPKNVPVVFINAPGTIRDGLFVRPQTLDTVIAWLKTNPQLGSCLAVSSQPYVDYQKAVIQFGLPSGFEIEAVGPAIQGEPSVALMLDTIAKQLLYEKKIAKANASIR